MNGIASSIPGRLRLRHPALRERGRLVRLGELVHEWPGICAVMPNPVTGSLLASYDPALLTEPECRRRAEAAMSKLLSDAKPRAAAIAVSKPARRPRITPANANRIAKPVMLASLATSLALAAAGAKRAHILTGIAFLHALGVHVWVQRRNLFR